MLRQTVTTADVAPKDRLPFLIEEFGRSVQRVDWRPAEHIDPLRLKASCTFGVSGDIRVADVQWSSGKVAPATGAFNGTLAHHLIVFRERAQSGWYELADGTVHHTVPGSIMLYPAEQAFVAGGVAENSDFDFQLAMVPRSAFDGFKLSLDIPEVLALSPGQPFNDLLSSYLRDWAAALPELDPVPAATATRTLVNLLAVADGALDARSPEALRDVSAARVRAARRHIHQHVASPELSPPTIAVSLGISLRQLHLDFEPTGTTVARAILLARTDLAKRLLAERPHLSIIEVAFACGFDAVSTFYRVFKAQTGMTATDYRRQALGF